MLSSTPKNIIEDCSAHSLVFNCRMINSIRYLRIFSVLTSQLIDNIFITSDESIPTFSDMLIEFADLIWFLIRVKREQRVLI